MTQSFVKYSRLGYEVLLVIFLMAYSSTELDFLGSRGVNFNLFSLLIHYRK
jgi:hypothetical protein